MPITPHTICMSRTIHNESTIYMGHEVSIWVKYESMTKDNLSNAYHSTYTCLYNWHLSSLYVRLRTTYMSHELRTWVDDYRWSEQCLSLRTHMSLYMALVLSILGHELYVWVTNYVHESRTTIWVTNYKTVLVPVFLQHCRSLQGWIAV